MTPQETIELIALARNVSHRLNLDEYETQALKPLLKAVRQAQREILARIQAKAATLPEWSENRALALLDELSDLTLALQNRIHGDISGMSSHAGAESYLIHNDIVSFGGRVADFNNVALTAGQIAELIEKTPVGGKLLADWIDSSFDWRLKSEIQQEVISGMLQGEGYPGFVDRLGRGFDMVQEDAISLARTYVQSTNVAAQEAVYRANKQVVQGWRWSAVMEPGYGKTGRGTCIICASLDGRIYQEGDPGRPEIPKHLRCLTPETPVFAPDKITAFVSTYSGPVFEIGLTDGRRFTITPNHLFLTGDGFTPAKSLRKGGNIISSAGAKGPPSDIGPNNYGNQARIDETIEAFAKTPGMRTVSMPRSAENFHGDGKFIKGDVDIIAPDSLLRGDFEAFFNEHGGKFPFPFIDPHLPVSLTALSNFYKPLFWLRLATGSLVGGKSVSDILLSRSARHHEAVGLQFPSNGYASINQPGPDCAAGNFEFFGNGVLGNTGKVIPDDLGYWKAYLKFFGLGLPVDWLDAISFEYLADTTDRNAKILSEFARTFAGQISFANIDFIRERYFTGHVYDLQTLTSLYYINWTIASNCRCMWLPELISWKELGLNIPEMEDVYRPYTIRPDKNIDAGGKREILEVGFHQGDYASWFATRDRTFQLNAVGPGRLELLESGKVKFEDLVTRGGKLRTLKELEGL